MAVRILYCTNVHAGAELTTMAANLSRYALAVKRRVTPDDPMAIGLWLAAPAARALRDPQQLGQLAAWLAEHDLLPTTLNGFPYGDFHQPSVKYGVYEPTWLDRRRLEYTLDLIAAQDGLLPLGLAGSISTLPIAWGTPVATPDQLQCAAGNLLEVATALDRLEARTGRRICLCLEPEPGCVLQRSADVVAFFQTYLLSAGDSSRVLRYLRVCHDICHAAVMWEDQQEALARYAAAGIAVGKVQVSSAVQLDFDVLPPSDRRAAGAQLAAFAEDRYLHQTTITGAEQTAPVLFDDLPAALASQADSAGLRGQWRVHFHVPIYLAQFGYLGTTRDQILPCLVSLLRDTPECDVEIETYAWGVLPPELQRADLAEGIAREMAWLRERLTE